ncbi:MAG TPA: secretin N-terminal domain-containing protein [Myxococcota bacterium]|jgi:type II secretory pathway component HofQ|nr:secretin N-terminal domain-containing protein [Myxococcota bacterium]
MRAPLHLVLLACAALWLALPAGAQVMRVYEVRYRTAEDLLPIAETAMSGEGRAVADGRTNSIVLSGTRQAVEGALALLASLDVRTRSVVIRYEARSAQELASRGASVRWSTGAGPVRIGNVVFPGGDSRVAVRVDEGTLRSGGTLAGTLRILDGQTGRIATGTSVPVTARRVQPGPAGPVWTESTSYVDADSGFEASPRILGDGRIELSLRPFDAQVQRDGSIRHSGAETRIVLEPGRTVALGGIVRDARAEQRSTLSGGATSRGSDESLLLVTAEIE